MHLRVDANGQIHSITGDKANALSQGYACFKGLQSPVAHQSNNRLLRPQRRNADGGFESIEIERALDEIAEKLRSLSATHGPDSIAAFLGNGAIMNATAHFMQRAFLDAIGSRQHFSTLTIDQSAKLVAHGRLGTWAGGLIELDEMNVALFFGANPLLSHSASSYLSQNPVRALKEAKSRGLRLVVVDPRRTETAHFADVFLQPFPGRDAVIAAGLIRIILERGWEDAEFCQRYVGDDRMKTLRSEVSSHGPEMVGQVTGLDPGQLLAAATLFAGSGRMGVAYGSTGPDMAPFSNLAQHLIQVLNVICGRFRRAGDSIRRVDLQSPSRPVRAEVRPPQRSWERSPVSRIRGCTSLFGERLSGTLSDEILTPGDGQIRALLVNGANPALSLPDQKKAVKALSSLDLLVTLTPWMTPTAMLSGYILPPLMQYERCEASFPSSTLLPLPGSWIQYTKPAVPPPQGSSLVEEWYVFWSLAKRLDKAIVYAGKPISMNTPPTTDDLIAARIAYGGLTTADIKANVHGHDFLDGSGKVEEPQNDNGGRFDVMPADVAAELKACSKALTETYRAPRADEPARFLLSTRRLRDYFNSNGMEISSIRTRTPYNPAFLNGKDMRRLNVADGEIIKISSSHGTAMFFVEQDNRVRSGVVSISHGVGALPHGNSNLSSVPEGTCINLLIDDNRNYESINAMPHMSAVPVNITKL
jgi:anaerobic selenocysteine-containing dehydrogenase